MKRLVPFLFLLILAGCATAKQSYHYEIKEYVKPLPNYPLTAAVYYKPRVEGSQLFEMEFNQYGTAKTGYFRVAFGSITFTKFNSAFKKMFKETQRSLVTDRPTRLLETKSKNYDLLCDIELVEHSFRWEKQEGFAEGYVKQMFNPLPRKVEYKAATDFKIKVSFYAADGSVVLEKTYPYAASEPAYLSLTNWTAVLLETGNRHFSNGVDEIISKVADDLRNSEKFK